MAYQKLGDVQLGEVAGAEAGEVIAVPPSAEEEKPGLVAVALPAATFTSVHRIEEERPAAAGGEGALHVPEVAATAVVENHAGTRGREEGASWLRWTPAAGAAAWNAAEEKEKPAAVAGDDVTARREKEHINVAAKMEGTAPTRTPADPASWGAEVTGRAAASEAEDAGNDMPSWRLVGPS
eukprot:GHVU01198202.1.p1 GENE.GHVU01198202.1~~GHVU01198202.1.p1  ORF type:complete len:197 (+),score=39.71 GHVU01198202.1:50-592(+)